MNNEQLEKAAAEIINIIGLEDYMVEPIHTPKITHMVIWENQKPVRIPGCLIDDTNPHTDTATLEQAQKSQGPAS